MKRVLLFRHSHAQSPLEAPDRERQLSDLGVQQARRIMAVVLNRGLVPDLGLVSPYRRARQTMALLLEACRESGLPEFEVRDWLGCCADGDPKSAMKHLKSLDSAATVVVVGHEPFVSGLVLQATLRRVEVMPCDLIVLGWNGAEWTFEENLTYSGFLD